MATTSNAMQRMMAARTKLLLDYEFYGHLVMKLRLVEDPSRPTAWTDGTRIGFNPAFIDTLSNAEILGVWVHEAMHCAHGHCWRRDGRDHRRWNEAADRTINPIITQDGFKLPSGALYAKDPEHEGHDAEWVYARLVAEQPQPQQPTKQGGEAGQDAGDPAAGSQPGPDGESGQDESSDGQVSPQPDGQDQDGTGAGQSGEGEDEEDAQNGGGAGPDDGQAGSQAPDPSRQGPAGNQLDDDPPGGFGEVLDAPTGTDEDEAQTEEEWKQALEEAATVSKVAGKLPAHLERMVRDVNRTRVDWRSAMIRFAQEQSRDDYTFARPNRRYFPSGYYLPALHTVGMGPLAILVDTSGSIDEVLLAAEVQALREIIAAVRPRMTYVIHCDTKVHKVEEFGPDDLLEITPIGGGGTDFRPAFKAVDDLPEPVAAIVYLTDTYGQFPTTPPAAPVLWATETKDAEVPFGDIVHVEA